MEKFIIERFNRMKGEACEFIVEFHTACRVQTIVPFRTHDEIELELKRLICARSDWFSFSTSQRKRIIISHYGHIVSIAFWAECSGKIPPALTLHNSRNYITFTSRLILFSGKDATTPQWGAPRQSRFWRASLGSCKHRQWSSCLPNKNLLLASSRPIRRWWWLWFGWIGIVTWKQPNNKTIIALRIFHTFRLSVSWTFHLAEAKINVLPTTYQQIVSTSIELIVPLNSLFIKSDHVKRT